MKSLLERRPFPATLFAATVMLAIFSPASVSAQGCDVPLRNGVYDKLDIRNRTEYYKDVKNYFLSDGFRNKSTSAGFSAADLTRSLGGNYQDTDTVRSMVQSMSEERLYIFIDQLTQISQVNTEAYKTFVLCKLGGLSWVVERVSDTDVTFSFSFFKSSAKIAWPIVLHIIPTNAVATIQADATMDRPFTVTVPRTNKFSGASVTVETSIGTATAKLEAVPLPTTLKGTFSDLEREVRAWARQGFSPDGLLQPSLGKFTTDIAYANGKKVVVEFIQSVSGRLDQIEREHSTADGWTIYHTPSLVVGSQAQYVLCVQLTTSTPGAQ